jgi:hypothetical protein
MRRAADVGWDDGEVVGAEQVHAAILERLDRLRAALAPELVAPLDDLLDRRGFRTADPEALLHPLGQPIVAFPLWVAASLWEDRSPPTGTVLDIVEATVTGYLYVRVHDDRLDEGIGDPDEALLLAHALLVRHQVLLARHVGVSPRFWTLFEQVAGDYAAAMLFERRVARAGAAYGPAEFDRVLLRSQPLVLPGAALLEVADRWDRLDGLQRFVHHTVRAGQLVDDLLDCEADRAAGRLTWVVRRLGGEHGATTLARTLLGGGIDAVVADVLDDVSAAERAATEIGLDEAQPWLAARRAGVEALRTTVLLRFLMG